HSEVDRNRSAVERRRAIPPGADGAHRGLVEQRVHRLQDADLPDLARRRDGRLEDDDALQPRAARRLRVVGLDAFEHDRRVDVAAWREDLLAASPGSFNAEASAAAITAAGS